ncbi:MAG: hypothetical protein EB116_13765, partial [Betaproteobacteria bacterium]|nr:hypothetical protein [Betaproteobacteria bacterium]
SGPACHASALARGSATVFVEGQAVGRIGDPVACQGPLASIVRAMRASLRLTGQPRDPCR